MVRVVPIEDKRELTKAFLLIGERSINVIIRKSGMITLNRKATEERTWIGMLRKRRHELV